MRGISLVLMLLLAGCAASPSPSSTSKDAGSVWPAPDGVTDAETSPRFETTQVSFDYVVPSFAVADQWFMGPSHDLRLDIPDPLNETLIEARIVPDGAMVGGWGFEVYERVSVGQTTPHCSDETLARADHPDDDGIYRIILPPGTWTCNGLAATAFSRGDPVGALVQAHVDVWTTTFEGMTMPMGFTAVEG